ncbi:MAG: hypothetical protein ACRDAM_16780 [Casimicrobium sp.]
MVDRSFHIACALATAFFSTHVSAQQLNAQELEALYSKPMKVFYFTPSGATGRAEYSPDRKMWIDISTPRAMSDKGIYRFDADKVCFKWEKLRDGKEVCFNVMKKADGKYDIVDGTTLNSTFEIR